MFEELKIEIEILEEVEKCINSTITDLEFNVKYYSEKMDENNGAEAEFYRPFYDVAMLKLAVAKRIKSEMFKKYYK